MKASSWKHQKRDKILTFLQSFYTWIHSLAFHLHTHLFSVVHAGPYIAFSLKVLQLLLLPFKLWNGGCKICISVLGCPKWEDKLVLDAQLRAGTSAVPCLHADPIVYLHFAVGPRTCPSNHMTLGHWFRLSERTAVCGLPSTSDMLFGTCPYTAVWRSAGSRWETTRPSSGGASTSPLEEGWAGVWASQGWGCGFSRWWSESQTRSPLWRRRPHRGSSLHPRGHLPLPGHRRGGQTAFK